jgi:hypothetical protein
VTVVGTRIFFTICGAQGAAQPPHAAGAAQPPHDEASEIAQPQPQSPARATLTASNKATVADKHPANLILNLLHKSIKSD